MRLKHPGHCGVMQARCNGRQFPAPGARMTRFTFTLATALVLAAGFAGNARAADVTGAGASFIYPVMTKWSADYAAATGNKVNYQSIGSGGGIAQIKAATVDFGS